MKITATSLNADGTGPVAIIITDGANSARLVVQLLRFCLRKPQTIIRMQRRRRRNGPKLQTSRPFWTL
jgi:hypothetical protein